MSRPRRGQLTPWVEQTILRYGTKETMAPARLWAHVVGVGQMTESQVQDAAGSTMMLFLSDGVVQIPALLRQQALDTLQEHEERECMSSLSNCTVCVMSYSLHFHMAQRKTKCRFFLWIDEIITAAYRYAKDSPPCCTTLPSVQQKIADTWRSLSNQDSVHTQDVFSLSELLGEWKDERVDQLVQEVGQLLKTPYSGRCGWAADRLSYQGEEVFRVPVSHLLIPQDLHHSDESSSTQSGLVPPSEDVHLNASWHGEPDQTITDKCNRLADMPAILEREDSGHEVTLPSHEVTLPGLEVILPGPEMTLAVHVTTQAAPAVGTDMRESPQAAPAVGTDMRDSPWDMFAPAVEMLRTSSSSDLSMTSEVPEESLSLLEPPLAPPAHIPMATSTQVPSQKSGVSQKSEDRSLPPYQRPHPSYSLAPAPPLHPLPSEQEGAGKVKRRSGKKTLSSAHLEEEVEQQVVSPPTWLFESLLVPRSRGEGPGCKPSGEPEDRHTNVHSDGSLFLYSYQPSEQLRLDLYKLKVPDSLLDWAVKYLLPAKQTDVAKATQP